VGASLARAAESLGITSYFLDASSAFAAPRVVRAMSWRLGGHRPPALARFSREVLLACERWHPSYLLSTGLAPIDAATLASIGKLGVRRINYLTDDPWNPTVRAVWFFDALREYDQVFSPRTANLDDLARHGCPATYLPFGFDPELSFHEEPASSEERDYFATDIAFVGGADADRVPFVQALVDAGISIGLYGGYWDRYGQTRRHARGHADVHTVRKATSTARVSLCLTRRANRDGHVMRSLEIPATHGCMLAEETDEHRALFGPSGDAVTYFRTTAEMVERVKWLLDVPSERRRLASNAFRRVQHDRHTYADRLHTMLTCSP
jgi:hypothetical protein